VNDWNTVGSWEYLTTFSLIISTTSSSSSISSSSLFVFMEEDISFLSLIIIVITSFFDETESETSITESGFSEDIDTGDNGGNMVLLLDSLVSLLLSILDDGLFNN